MKKTLLLMTIISLFSVTLTMAQQPGTDQSGWKELFARDLSDAEFPAGIWTYSEGILTASEDQCIWTKRDYKNFMIDLEFKTAEGTNSGVIVYCSDVKNWIPNSVEIQIADDFAKQWAESPKTWQCGRYFRAPGCNQKYG